MTTESAVQDDAGDESDGSGCVILLGVGLIALGIWILFLNVRAAAFREEAKSWTETPCQILTAELISRSKSGDPTRIYRVDFSYAYEVDGKHYVGTRDGVMESYSMHRVAQKLMRAHPVGSETVCYVNPSDPSDAILGRSISNLSLLLFWVFGGSSIAVGGWFLFATIRSRFDEE